MTQKVTSVRTQLESILRDRIEQGLYAADSRLPAESKLAEELGVSRPTLRTTLAKLETQGLITRKQGDGTYVNKHVFSVDATPKAYWNFASLIEESGRTAECQVLSVERRHPTKPEAAVYGLAARETVLAITALFLADRRPVIHSTGLLPLAYVVVEQDEYDFNRPLNVYVKEYCQQEISYSISDISAAFAPLAVTQQLKLARKTPVLKFVDTFYNVQNDALVHGLSYFCDELIRMRVAHSWG